jgi:hypothetical protein
MIQGKEKFKKQTKKFSLYKNIKKKYKVLEFQIIFFNKIIKFMKIKMNMTIKF